MKREAIYDKIKEIIEVTFKGEVSLADVNEDTNLITAIGINSIVGIEILLRVEAEFGIQFEDEDLSSELVRSLSTLADYIERKLEE